MTSLQNTALIAATFIAASAHSVAAQQIAIDFEQAEGFSPGEGLEGSSGWAIHDAAVVAVDPENAAGGIQSLRIGPSEGAVAFTDSAVPATGVRFIDLYLGPVAADAGAVQTSLHAFGADLGFMKGANGRILVAVAAGDGEAPEAKFLGTTAVYDESGASDRWLRLTLRQDADLGIWDVFADGRLKAVNLPLDPQAIDALVFYANPVAAVYVDSVSISAANPLFPDADADGMPDAWEEANGLDPLVNDRNADADLDGVPNIHERLAGTNPAQARKKGRPPEPTAASEETVELSVHTPLR